jgi:hypothetical protein
MALARSFLDFIQSNKSTATAWSGQAAVADFFPTQLGKSEEQYRNPGAAATTAADSAKAQAAGLFAEIQQKSLSSQADFKHVEKNAHKKNPASAGEIPQPKAPVTRTAKPAEDQKP